ncbi:hypothetical protein CS022_24055 [Veronia nyctiphanis]|uniref:Uncharacterized protein n=1 Tax=Veronia nyctiphanis TaxID=1278244 RepID=A0A4Q0YER5_9GAMM|nr:EAL domain-containing protein [Veronia nyctiphanis]RXJ68703.1 hypothetical protein CS022_24055 [Veronia nyctiphanis]
MTRELINQEDFEAHLVLEANGDVTAMYRHISLTSVFQPIFNRAREVMGYEALCRVTDDNGQHICCTDIFYQCCDENWVIHQHNLDKLSRVVHLRNFSQYNVDCSLFLNVLPISAIRGLTPTRTIS